jgi:hypothetical protein
MMAFSLLFPSSTLEVAAFFPFSVDTKDAVLGGFFILASMMVELLLLFPISSTLDEVAAFFWFSVVTEDPVSGGFFILASTMVELSLLF